jgi:hypothetical protein
LVQQKKKLQEKESHLELFAHRINNPNLDLNCEGNFLGFPNPLEDFCDEEDRFLTGDHLKKGSSCDRSTAENTMINNFTANVSNFDARMVCSFDVKLESMGSKGRGGFSGCEDASMDKDGSMFNLNQSVNTVGTISGSTVIDECRSNTASQLGREKLESERAGFMRVIKTVLIFILLATVVGLLVIK